MKVLQISLAPLLIGTLLILGWAPLSTAQQPVFVETVGLTKSQETERVIGSLRARSTSVMAALEEGAILELAVREADLVKRGAVLARVDSRRLLATRLQLQADLAMGAATLLEREAQLTNATADFKALSSAAKSGAVSDRDLRNAKTAVATGGALVQAAKQSIVSLEASRDLLDLRIEDAVVRAPFDARVVSKHAEVGQWIRPGDPLVTLVSTGPVEAWLELPERFIGRFDESAESVALRIEASGQVVNGLTPRSIPIVDEKVRSFTLILDITGEVVRKNKLRPGMSISAMVPLGKASDQIVVPKDAILRRGTDALIVKVGEGNVAELIPVRILFDSEASFAIEPLVPGGIEPGDLVVVEGNERIYPGTPVTPIVKGKEQEGAAPAPEETGTEQPRD